MSHLNLYYVEDQVTSCDMVPTANSCLDNNSFGVFANACEDIEDLFKLIETLHKSIMLNSETRKEEKHLDPKIPSHMKVITTAVVKCIKDDIQATPETNQGCD